LPASSYSGLNSWGGYIVASAMLVALFSNPLHGLATDSREGVDLRYADGIRAALDELTPGMSLHATYAAAQGADQLHLGGRSLSINYGNGTIVIASAWELQNATLMPGSTYRFWLSGGEVQVTSSVGG
jgi:hypothetical protein